MTKTVTILSATGAALLASLGKTPIALGEHEAYVTGAQTLGVQVQVRARAPRGQPRTLQFRALGLLTDTKKGPVWCAGAWHPTENEALRSLQVDFEQSGLPRLSDRISADMHFQGALSIPDAGRRLDYRDPPLFEDLAAA